MATVPEMGGEGGGERKRTVEVQAAAGTATEPEMAGEGGGERKRKKTLGRRKIEIKPIKCVEAKHVCFSKRREGLYKKAVELCALTGAQVAIVVSSPAGKFYSFGHSSVGAVLARYRDPCPAAAAAAAAAARDAPRPAILDEYDGECDRLREAIEAEARRRDALEAAARAAGAWTDDAARRAGMHDLVAMHAALERVKAEAAAAEHAMRHQCAADAYYYDDGDGQHQRAAVDAQMAMLMGGNFASHAAYAPLPFGPMTMLPPDLPPPPQLPFCLGSDHNHVAGYADCSYDLGDGSGHGAAYDGEGYCSGTAAPCNFFG